MGEGREDVFGGAVLAASGEGRLDQGARGGEVAAAVLVDLGDLLPGSRVEPSSAADGRFPEGAGLVPAGAALLDGGQPEEDALPSRACQALLERHAVAGEAPVDVGDFPDAAKPDQLLGMEVGDGSPGDRAGDPARERSEREDVVAVVLEDPRERSGCLPPEVVEVREGISAPGKVVVPRMNPSTCRSSVPRRQSASRALQRRRAEPRRSR